MNKYIRYLVIPLGLILSLVLNFATPTVSADSDDNATFKETKEEEASFNPTEPEVQLGDIKEVDIKESGAVILDSKTSQGIITGEKLVEIDGVKGKGKITYILDKESQDIISVHSENLQIVGEDESTVQINEVDELIGNNGVADKDGFKSNLVPDNIPKTGLPPVSDLPMYLGMLGIIFLVVYTARRKLGTNNPTT